MKAIFFFLSALCISVAGYSQESAGKTTTSGRIIYEDKVKLEIKLEGDAAQFAESLPKERSSNMILMFNTDKSLYKVDDSKKSDEIMDQPSGNMTVRMVISGGNDITYSDLVNKKRVEQKEFMTRTFLIESDLANSDWKFTGNNRTVLGYNCQEAVREDKDKKISAWFAPAIPVSTGPAVFGGLPGLVLMVDIDNGKHSITATSIDPSFSDASLITKPKDGKKVTSDEFKQIVDDKMKEMGADGGQGGGAHVMIRINK